MLKYALLLSTALLAGCAGGLPGTSTPNDTFSLSSAPVVKAKTARHRQLLIVEPTALKAIDSEKIVIRTSPSAIQYLSKAQWDDRLPKIVQARLIDAFENSGLVGGVGRPGDGLAIDYKIIVNIRSFEVFVTGQDAAQVSFSVKILNDKTGNVRATNIFSAQVLVGGSSNEQYVLALDRAFGKVAHELVAWTLSKI